MRILFADDDARIGKHVRQALVAEGYAVDYAEDGDEALWLAENNPYDAIILDVMMPGVDGYQLCRRLRSDPRTQHIPIMIITGHAEGIYQRISTDLGAKHMTKPFHPFNLLEKVKVLLQATPQN